MVTKDYVIIAIVCLFTVAAIVGIAIAGQNAIDAQADILEESEVVEETEPVVEETIPEPSAAIKPMVEIPKPNIVEATEPPVEETEPVTKTTTYTEPPATEPPTTYTEATEPVVEETEPPATEATEPVVEETEPPATEPAPEPTEEPVVEEEAPKDPYDPVELLACVIYQEAGSDNICDDCRYRVADVVLNRVADSRYPDTIYGVLTQSGQYGSYSSTGVVWPSRANNSGEKHAVQRAYNIATSVIAGTHSKLYGQGYIYQAKFVQGVDNIYCCRHYFGR